MEKFCIVKRRKQNLRDPFCVPFPVHEEAPSPRPMTSSPPQEIISRKEPVLSLNLTPWQSRAIRSGGILPFLGEETSKNVNLNLRQEEDGSIVFNFHFDLDQDYKMLKPDQVCQMLQISRGLLNRMVKEGKLKSYKIGRLRRFYLREIVETLDQGSTETSLGF